MGLYIDPPASIPKLDWLKANAKPLHEDFPNLIGAFTMTKAEGNVILAYAQNPDFDVIAVMFNQTEFRRFLNGRPDARYFVADKKAVLDVCPEAKEALRQVKADA